ncbi:hypothetical protein ACFQY7_37560 [Actinomadura luteofluorescens]|uniref:hypothetical protein n=1 Tax=Actinomadura luteofluorescens TaxID=46163 RepID=UPI003637404E
MPEQVPVVDRPEPEVFETVIGAVIDEGVEGPGVGGDEGGQVVRQEALAVRGGDGLGERPDAAAAASSRIRPPSSRAATLE